MHDSSKSATAWEAIERIAKLYEVEKQARFKTPERRVALRQEYAKPLFDDLEPWLMEQLNKMSGKTPLAKAIQYALTRLPKARPYLDHGFLELDNKTAERAVRPGALGRKRLSIHGIRGRGQIRRHRLYSDRDIQAQSHRSRGLACLGAGTHPRSPREPYQRADAMGISGHRRGAES